MTTPRTGLLGSLSDPRLPSGVLACVSLLVAGWTLTLFPSLIRSVKEAFGQTDAGIGLACMAYALAYTAGSFGGGVLIEHAGRSLPPAATSTGFSDQSSSVTLMRTPSPGQEPRGSGGDG